MIFCERLEKVVLIVFYCILIEIWDELFDLIGWEAVRTILGINWVGVQEYIARSLFRIALLLNLNNFVEKNGFSTTKRTNWMFL